MIHRFLLFLVATGLLTGCGAGPSIPRETNEASTVIYVSIPPLAALTQIVVGPEYEVRSVVETGEDPHTFAPSAKRLAEISQARALYTVGMPFLDPMRAHLTKVAPGLVVVNLQAGIELEGFEDHEGHDHDGHDHHGDEMDPHTWLSPSLLKDQIRNLVVSLSALNPKKTDDFVSNAQTLVEQIEAIRAHLADELAPFEGRAIYVHHAAFGYFVREFGMEQQSVELGGRSPSAKQLEALVASAKADDVKIIFTQPQFDPSSAEKLAEAIGGTVVAMDPLSPDLLHNFETLGEAVKAALKPAAE